ncbi:hypothetical protein ACEPAI_8886 [Sanghuangporus weigelae]
MSEQHEHDAIDDNDNDNQHIHGAKSSSSSSDSSPPSSDDLAQLPRTPASASSPNVDSPLLSQQFQHTPWPRSSSSGYINSPLNPNAQPLIRSRPSSARLSRLMSEEAAAFGANAGGQRGSMLLYKLAIEDDPNLPVPNRRSSFGSDLSFDGKYPSGTPRGVIPYVYDPDLDDGGPEDDFMKLDEPRFSWSWRGIANFGLLFTLIIALLCLFILYPVVYFVTNNDRLLAIDNNIHINATGQNPVLFQMPQLVDPDTPEDAKTRTGFDGRSYSLVFSDEFNLDGRSFYPGDDPYWEAVDLWYWATADLEWYDPRNAFTRGGNLVLLVEQVTDLAENHGLQFRSAMVQSWNKFCFSKGYMEVRLSLPGPNEATQGYWPGAWTMGNLGRPGYGATTDGIWPYSYNSCDVGTFPNQTYANGSGPAAALQTEEGRERYNFELSWLTGQKLSSCTCPGGEHPGPAVNLGRGAPEIDALEAQKNKLGDGGKVSQSAQFAPFSHDYEYENATSDDFVIYDLSITQPNTYHGSAVQQAVSALTDLPADIYNGTGGNFYTFGFEYWTDPAHPEQGYVQWQANGNPSFRMGASAMAEDPLPDGSGVGRRLIPEEPMSIILNLAISESFQDVDLTTMTFPAEYLIDYVRVYQRDGEQNVGCSPQGYPTADYINDHLEAYTNPNWTTWEEAGYTKPRNSLYDGC